jgi:tRNA(fMet)-specific endonuclease VapC
MLDSDTSSYVIRQRSTTVANRLQRIIPADVCISIVTRAEILFGLTKLPKESRIHERAAIFLAEFESLPWDEAAAEQYAEVRSRLERQGTPIGIHDTLIAAHAVSIGAILVTNNTRHFERIGTMLQLENWHRD